MVVNVSMHVNENVNENAKVKVKVKANMNVKVKVQFKARVEVNISSALAGVCRFEGTRVEGVVVENIVDPGHSGVGVGFVAAAQKTVMWTV